MSDGTPQKERRACGVKKALSRAGIDYLDFENLFMEYNNIFQMIFRNLELKHILDKLIINYESVFPGSKCSILLQDKEDHQAANECDQLRTCRSVPIYSSQGKVLGTFVIYYPEPGRPSDKELYVIEAAGMLAGLAIEHHQNLDNHRTRQEKLEQVIQQRTSEIEKQYRYIKRAKGDIEAGLRAKSEFLVNVSHELRTPLNAVIGFSDLLSEEYYGALNDKQKEFIGHIQKSSRSLLELINNVIEISKIEADSHQIKLARIKIQPLINLALTFVREKATKHSIKICLDIPPELLDKEYISDLSVLKTVLMNVMVNAVKFTADGGLVTLSVRQEENMLVLKVTDTGVGVEKELQEKIFESFYQVKRSINEKSYGAGLGLAVSRKMIEMLGGRIWVESEGNMKGSTFYFKVPVQEGGKAESDEGN